MTQTTPITLKLVLLLLLLFSLLSSLYSADFASLEIEVLSDGTSTISGISTVETYKELTSQEFTSKSGEYWTFNFSTPESFEEFIYEFTLPKGAVINYLKTTQNFRIENQGEQIKIVASGENKSISILCQYSISKDVEASGENPIIDYPLLVMGFVFVVAVFFGFVLHIFLSQSKKNKAQTHIEDTDIDEVHHHHYSKEKSEEQLEEQRQEEIREELREHLPKRQQEILTLLEKHKTLTQKEVEEYLDIPKSSISRNISTLEVKGYLTRERTGNTNYIVLTSQD